MEIWDKTFNFEDKIALLVLKTIILKKRPLFVKEFFKIWQLRMELWDKIFRFEDNTGLPVLKTIIWKK